MPKPLWSRRGLTWEDKVTAKFNEFPMTTAYNLGGSTLHIPDVIVFSEYVPNGFRQATFYENDQPEFKLKFPFVLAMECKASNQDHYDIPKEQVDKCFEFLTYLSSVNRYIALTFKFQTSKKKSNKFMIMFEYDPVFPNADFSFFRCYNNGTFSFYGKPDGKQRSKPSGFLNMLSKSTKVKLFTLHNFDIRQQ